MPIVLDDVCFNKAGIMERCLRRVFEEAHFDPDLAMQVVSRDRLGMPQNSADAFGLLHQKGVLSCATASALAGMVGFRNGAVDMDIVRAIVAKDWRVFVVFSAELGLRVEP